MLRPLLSNDRLQTLLSSVTFKTMGLHTAVNDVIRFPVISTGRPFSFYRAAFFAGRSEAAVLAELQDKVIVDIGCGLTPFVSDSMFQACERAGIAFYGIDPKIGRDFVFGKFDQLKVWATGGRGRIDPQAPGTSRAIAAFADRLPFEAGQVDLILSSFLLTVWIHDEELLANIYQEFHRVLKSGGSVRVYPQPKFDLAKVENPRLAEILGRFTVHQEFLAGLKLLQFPPAYVTTLTKR